MHTYTWEGTSETYRSEEEHAEVVFQFNSDFSGRVTMILPTSVAEPQVSHFTKDGEDHHVAEVRVPFEALEAFVLDSIRTRRIKELENMSLEVLRAVMI